MIAPAKRAVDHSANALRQRRRAALKGLGLSACLLAASAAIQRNCCTGKTSACHATRRSVTAAYGKLMNHGNETVEISGLQLGERRDTEHDDCRRHQRRMVQLMSVEIAPHETLIFEPGGRHIMLLDEQSAL